SARAVSPANPRSLADLVLAHRSGGQLDDELRPAERRRVFEPDPAADLRHDTLTDRRSEEHTSELQSRFDLVCRLLLEKKNYLGMSAGVIIPILAQVVHLLLLPFVCL